MWSLARGIEDRGNPTIESRALILADRGCGFLYLVNAMKFMSMSAEDAIRFQERALDVIECDYETGLFRWKKTGKGIRSAGWFEGSECSNGYKRICVLGNRILCHQLVWLMYYGSTPSHEIDHKNGIRSDNRISNLRDVTPSENHKNSKLYIANTSGYVGVCFCKKTKKWQAQIQVGKRYIFLGYFNTKDEAIAARKAADTKYGFDPSHGKRI